MDDDPQAEVTVKGGANVKAAYDRGLNSLMKAARAGYIEVLQFIVDQRTDVDVRDIDSQTPLMRAAEGGHLDVVQFLIKNGAAVDAWSNDGQTSLIITASKGHLDILRLLVDHRADVNGRNKNGLTPLMSSAKNGKMEIVEFLMERGADMNARDKFGSSPLVLAAENGHLNVMQFLVEHRAAVDDRSDAGWPPLIQAAYNHHWDVVQYLAERGAAVGASKEDYSRLLDLAARRGKLDIVRFSLEHGATVDPSDEDGKKLLFKAAEKGDLDMVRFLVDHGADVNDRNWYGQTLLICAANNDHLDVVRFLVERGAAVDDFDDVGSTSLAVAARSGHLSVVRFLVEHDADVNHRSKYASTPVMWAACRGHMDVVQFLVEKGAAVNGCIRFGNTLLDFAIEGGHLDMVRFLVEYGAVVNDRGGIGRKQLKLASDGGHWDVVHFLLEFGASVNARDSDSWMLLIRAAEDGHLNTVQFLVEHDVAVDVHKKSGTTPLLKAAQKGHFDVVQFLVKHGAVVEACNSKSLTPLMRAAHSGHLDVVRFLVEHRAAVNSRNRLYWTPLMLAADCGHLDVSRYLVEQGADMDASISDGRTSLMLATKKGHMNVVRYLVEHKAGVRASDRVGRMPLMWASRYGHLDIVRFLLKQGAIVDASDIKGRTSLDLAARGGHLDVVRFLVEHKVLVDDHGNSLVTPLIMAARYGHLDVLRYLVQHGAIVDARDNDGWTPLMLASRYDHIGVVRYLVVHFVHMDDISIKISLNIALKFGCQVVTRFLLKHVRHPRQRIQTVNRDNFVAQHVNIPSSWLIPPFEVEVKTYNNYGNFDGDYRGKWLDTDVVVKLYIDKSNSASFVDEVRLWYQLRHPNVLKLYGVCNTDYHHIFVCEYANNVFRLDVFDWSNDEPMCWKFLYEAALGLEYLHERKIVHGNLRGSNILIGNDGLAKLAGFGSSTSSPKENWFISSDWVRWAAPESLKGGEVSFASDVYSLGICIIETLIGDIPYEDNEDDDVRFEKIVCNDRITDLLCRDISKTLEVEELLLTMCTFNPRERLQMPAVVNKLKQFVDIQTANLMQDTPQPEPEPLVNFDALDQLNFGKTSSLWTVVQALVNKSENNLYRQFCNELKLIYDCLKTESWPWSTFQRFHDMLVECQHALDEMSQQSQVRRLSATRARDHSIQGLHRRITQLLQLIHPQGQDAETRETEWKSLCREQAEIFVSEVEDACVMLSSVDSEEDRSAFVAVLRNKLRNSDGKYTEKQLAVLQKTYDDIVSMSLKDVHLATTPEWFIPWFELEMNEMATLGEGGFGSVIKAKWLDTEVVVKKLEIAGKDAANVDKKREMRQMFEREVDIWFGLSHPHVVRLFGACHVGRPFFVCELASKGTLVEYLRRHPDELWSKLREAALGVQYLHARGIVHGDLKGNNIMIGSDGKAKVTDFGLSGVFGDDTSEMVLSKAWHWVAPECILGQKPTFASDVYSLGMCIIEALRVTNGDKFYLPWGDLPNAAVKHHVTKNRLLPQRPGNCSDEAWTLIERMCKSSPADRMLIMTVADELERLERHHWGLRYGINQTTNDIDKLRQLSSSVANALAEMITWIGKCDTRSDWEGSALNTIYKLLWGRFEQVATQMFPDGENTVVNTTTINDLTKFVERSKKRTRKALGITGVIPLIKFTELALKGYALHRRLDKFMAALAVPNEPSSLHDWKSACSAFMGVSNSPTPACSEEDCSANEETGDGARMASSTEKAAAS